MNTKAKTTPPTTTKKPAAIPPHRRPEDGGEVMTAEQAATFAGVGVDTIRIAIANGDLKGTAFPAPLGIRTTRQAVLDFITSGVGVRRRHAKVDDDADDDTTTSTTA